MRVSPGFTMVELTVAIAVGAMLIVSLYRLLGGGMRAFTGTQQRLQAVQVAQLAIETIEQDVRTLMLEDALDASFFSDLSPRETLELVATEQGPGGRAGVLFQGVDVEYALAPAPEPGVFCLRRNDVLLRSLTLSRLTFTPKVLGPPEDSHCFLQILVTAVDTFGKTSFSLASLVALDDMNRWRSARCWQLNPSAGRYRAAP